MENERFTNLGISLWYSLGLMDYLAGLNEKQKEAVTHDKGPLLIIAGAGAGKTKTITHRILHIIKKGITPSSILAITFTNKAAKEMRERMNAMLRNDRGLNLPVSFTEKPFISTFHSLGVHILQNDGEKIGIPKHFSIFDKTDSKKAVKEAMEEIGLDTKQFDPGAIMGRISKEKGAGVNLADFAGAGEDGKDFMGKITATVWQKYEDALRREKVLDFDDLLLKPVFLLKKYPDVLEKYQKKWSHIHIDEYQDTNGIQYEMTKLLSGEGKNITVVGDIDQNIYSWRGATIKNILDFEKEYPGTTIIRLEENYRSTQTILTVANRSIAKNKMRFEKTLFTKNGEGEKIGLFAAYDEEDEARFIVEKVKTLQNKGVPLPEIAVLYRANFQSRVIESAFLHADVPYQLLGTKFFERKEVKDVLSYVRLALNPDSLSDMKRTLNSPPRGIGKVTLLKILSGKEEGLTAGMKTKVAEWRNVLSTIRKAAGEEKPSEVIKMVLAKSGMEAWLKKGTDEDKERLENIRELVTLATVYDSLPKGEGISKLLTDAALQSDQDELSEQKDGVKLMTIHAAKGLEFDYCFITGLEDELFPHQRMGEGELSGEEEEEERRLFYVALTRARKKIYLSYANVRTLFGSRQVNAPSEFILDVDEEFIEPETSSLGRGFIKTIYF